MSSWETGYFLPGGAQSGVHISNLSLKKLKFSDRLSELFTLVCVWNGNIASGLHETDRAAGKDQSLEVQAGHEDISALSKSSEDVIFVDGDVFEYKLASWAKNDVKP